MASKAELITKIILKGQTDPSLQKAFKQANNLADSSIDKLAKYGQAVKKVAKAGAVAVGAGLTVSAKAAIDYESAFAGVMKTVNETGTTTYDDLSKGIINMSKQMPASATEIAGVAEAAGQLGIKADDVLKFTETMVNLGETTNLTSDEAATSIAKMFNIMGTSMKDVDRFGSTIVALGNNAATTEADIVNMASRIAAGGVQIGLTESEILALSTTLSSVGLEAEAGGTAISTVMANIDKDVAKNSATVSTWAELAGMSASEFSKLWSTDAYGALQKVIGGMGDSTKGGENLNLILEELEITGIRTSDTMKRLSNASGLMGDMTNLANTAWSENTALVNEANVRYNTMASKIQMAKNKIVAFGIAVGNQLMPYINKLLDAFNKIDFDSLAQKVGNAIQWISDHSTTIVAVLGAVAGAITGFKIGSFVITIYKIAKSIIFLSKTVGLMKLVGLAISAMGGPVTLVIAAIGLLVGAFAALWMKSEGFRNFWKGLWNGIKNVASTVGNWLKNFFTVTIPDAWNTCVTWFQTGVSKVGTFFVNIGTAIKNGFNTALNFIRNLPSRIWTWLLNTIAKINAWRLQMLAKAKEIGRSFINGIVTFFQQLPYKIGYFIGFCIGKVVQFGQKLWNFVTVTVPQFISGVAQWFAKLPSRIWSWLTKTVQKVIAWGSRMISIGKQKAMQFITAVISYIKSLPGKVWTWLTNTIQKVTAWGTRMLSIGRQKAVQFMTTVINFIKQLPGKVWTWLVNTAQKVVSWGTQLAAKGRAAAVKLYNAIVDKVKEIPGKMLSLGKSIVEGLWNGIKNAKNWLVSKVKSFGSGIIDGFKDSFGINSPSVIMAKLGKFLPMGLGEGIAKNAKYAVQGIKTMGGKVMSAASGIKPTIATKVASVGNKIKAFGKGGTVTSPQLAVVGDANETIVPHGNTPRNRSLLAEAARGVGISNGGGSVFNFTFAPVINGGNAEENRRMLQEEEAEFERKMDAYFAKKGRLAF